MFKKSENKWKYLCDCKNCSHVQHAKDEIFSAEEQQEMKDAIQAMVDNIQDVVRQIVDVFTPAVQAIVDNMSTSWNSVLYCGSSGRVRHLALHAKKTRVRKKNLHRMQKQFWKVWPVCKINSERND